MPFSGSEDAYRARCRLGGLRGGPRHAAFCRAQGFSNLIQDLASQTIEVSVAPQARAFVCVISGALFSSDSPAIGSQADVGIAASLSIGERRIWILLGAFVFSRERGAFSNRWPVESFCQ